MASDIGSIDLSIKMETTELERSIKQASSLLTENRKDFKLLDAQIKNVERTEEGYTSAKQRLSKQLLEQKKVVSQLQDAYEKQTKELGEDNRAVKKLRDTLRNSQIDVERTKKSIKGLNTELDKLGRESQEASKDFKEGLGSLDTIGSSLPGIGSAIESMGAGVMAGATAIVGGLGLIGTKSFEVSRDFEKANTNMVNSLGLTEGELKSFDNTMQDINQGGLVTDIIEASDVVVALKHNLGDLNQNEMKDLGEKTVALSHILKSDFNETLRSSQQLTNLFGTDTVETFDLITQAVQNGANKHQDLLDTINEYSTYFDQAGFTADDFFAILDQGLQNGIMNTDKVADGVKEFGIALGDTRIEKGIKAWSDQTQALFKKYQEGEATAKEVFNTMVNEINRTTGTQEKMNLIQSTGISQWEDWGTEGFNNLDKVQNKAYTTGGEVAKIVDVEKKHASGWQRLSAIAGENFFSPIGSKLNGFMNSLADAFDELKAYENRINAVKHAPTVSPAGYSEPMSKVGPQRPFSYNQNVTINSPKQLSGRDVAKEMRKQMNSFSRDWR